MCGPLVTTMIDDEIVTNTLSPKLWQVDDVMGNKMNDPTTTLALLPSTSMLR